MRCSEFARREEVVPAELVRSRCEPKVLGTPWSGCHGAAFPLLLKLVGPEAAPWALQVKPVWSAQVLLASSKADKSLVTMERILLPGTGVTLTSGHPAWDKVSTPSLTSAQCTGPAGLAWFWVTLGLAGALYNTAATKNSDKAHWYPESCLFFFFSQLILQMVVIPSQGVCGFLWPP